MTLLTQLHEQKRADRERLRLEMRSRLRATLGGLLPAGISVIVYGSLARPYAFDGHSDIDLAFASLPAGLSPDRIAAQIEERLECPVDAVLLAETRIAAAIRRTGETWTL